jgi:hypothetical protein
VLLPPGCSYENWREAHMPMLAGLLCLLTDEGAELDDYERRSKIAADAGLEPPPPPPISLWMLLRVAARTPSGQRAELVASLTNRRHPMPAPIVMRDHHGREHELPQTVSLPDVVRWLVGEALAHGIACDYATPYQTWWVFAELLLRDCDIGEIIAVVYPDRVGTRDPDLCAEAVKALNIDLARKERKRADAKRKTFGYRAA